MARAQVQKLLRSRISFHPLLRHLGHTALTGAGTLISAVAVVSLFSRLVGAAALAEYLLVRRVASWLQGTVQVCSGVGLPRYVALTAERSPEDARGYFCAALIFDSSVALIMLLILEGGKAFFARWLFGKAELQDLAVPLGIFALGLAVHSAVYGYFRGLLSMGTANALQVLDIVIAPLLLVVILRKQGSAGLIIMGMGGAMLIFSAGFGAVPLISSSRRVVRGLLGKLGQLLRYGIPRIPADLGLGSLASLAPIIAAHYLPMDKVAYLLLAGTLLTGISAAGSPLGIVLLSKISMMVGKNQTEKVQQVLKHLTSATVEVSIFVALQLIIFADVLIRIWVGPAFTGGVLVIRIILVAIPFYAYYVAMRNVLDAGSVRPHNSLNISASLVIFLCLVVAAIRTVPSRILPEGISLAWVGGMVSLGLLSGISMQRVFQVAMMWRRSLGVFLVTLAGAGISLWVHGMHDFQTSVWRCFLAELVAAPTFMFAVHKWGSGWLDFLWKTGLLRNSPEAVAGGGD